MFICDITKNKDSKIEIERIGNPFSRSQDLIEKFSSFAA